MPATPSQGADGRKAESASVSGFPANRTGAGTNPAALSAGMRARLSRLAACSWSTRTTPPVVPPGEVPRRRMGGPRCRHRFRALDATEGRQVDLALVAVTLPDLDGAALGSKLVASAPGCRVVLMSSAEPPEALPPVGRASRPREAVRSGRDGGLGLARPRRDGIMPAWRGPNSRRRRRKADPLDAPGAPRGGGLRRHRGRDRDRGAREIRRGGRPRPPRFQAPRHRRPRGAPEDARAAPDTLVILITGPGDGRERRRGDETRRVHYLNKPIDVDELLLHVGKALETTRFAAR